MTNCFGAVVAGRDFTVGVDQGAGSGAIAWPVTARASRDSPRRATHLFFASPKKSKQRKGEPTVLAACRRFPALLGARGVWLNSLRSDNASPDPLAPALLGPATRHWEIKTNTNTQAIQYAPWRVLGGFACGLRFCVCPHYPCGCAEQRSRAGWLRKDA